MALDDGLRRRVLAELDLCSVTLPATGQRLVGYDRTRLEMGTEAFLAEIEADANVRARRDAIWAVLAPHVTAAQDWDELFDELSDQEVTTLRRILDATD